MGDDAMGEEREFNRRDIDEFRRNAGRGPRARKAVRSLIAE